MLKKKFTTLFAFVILSAAMSFSSYAAGRQSFPFEVEFDNDDSVERLCYAGHKGSTVKYSDGVAVMPDTYFTVTPKAGNSDADPAKLSAELSLIYENEDNSGSYRETIRTFEGGSLEIGEDYQLFSDNTIASLEDRDLLYSGSLQGVVMTLNYDGRDHRKESMYLYVCDFDDYSTYLENMQE